MMIFDKKEQNSPSHKNNGEIRLASRAVSRGVAIGKVVCLHGQTRQFYRLKLNSSQIDREIRRFLAAIRLTKNQLTKISLQNKQLTKDKKESIFDVHLLILEDKSLISKIEKKIKDQKVNAEWAVKLILDGYIAKYKNISDEHLRDRYIDLQDISDRLLNSLGGGGKLGIPLKKDSIIVAKEVKPSTLIELTDSQPKAIITENGGWTSHTFILARELNLPAVTGTKNVLRRVKTGDGVIVDGYNGQVILNPTKKTLNEYKATAAHFQKINTETLVISKGNVKTLDGREIIIRTNLDLHTIYEKAEKLGAQGIGLYRSEFLFNQYRGYPTESEQLEAYKTIGKLVGEKGVRIRSFDLSIDQLADEKPEKEKNPALGLRGIRLALSHIKEFRTQLRALLQASAEFNIDIVLPMISDVAEIIHVKDILRKEKNYLKKKNIKFGNPKIGAMIEVPSAVLTVEEILEEVDFLSLGTNDLVQYLLAVDRDNESVADSFKTLHPAVLKSIEKVLTEAEKKEIPVVVCGEMAGSPFYAPILIGLGAKELSMNVNSISRIRKTISGIAFEEACDLVNKIRKLRTTEEIEQVVRQSFSQKWSHLLSPEIMPLK
jgi:phosphotransferase system enzyme I (PtsI)